MLASFEWTGLIGIVTNRGIADSHGEDTYSSKLKNKMIYKLCSLTIEEFNYESH